MMSQSSLRSKGSVQESFPLQDVFFWAGCKDLLLRQGIIVEQHRACIPSPIIYRQNIHSRERKVLIPALNALSVLAPSLICIIDIKVTYVGQSSLFTPFFVGVDAWAIMWMENATQ